MLNWDLMIVPKIDLHSRSDITLFKRHQEKKYLPPVGCKQTNMEEPFVSKK